MKLELRLHRQYERVVRFAKTRPATVLTALAILILVGLLALLITLWLGLEAYIAPQDASAKKDHVQAVAVTFGGLVALGGALAGLGTLYVSWRNLRQSQDVALRNLKQSQDSTRDTLESTRKVEEQRAQEAAFQAYLDQIVFLPVPV